MLPARIGDLARGHRSVHRGSGLSGASKRGCMSGDAQDDHTQDHQDNPSKEVQQEPPDDLWRILLGITELGALYFAYKQNEGAAQIAQALVLVIQMLRRER
jgi:hypothetical protein